MMVEKEYHRCLEYAQKGIDLCMEKNIMYLFYHLIYLFCGAKQDLNTISDRDRLLYEVGYNLVILKNDLNYKELYEEELVDYHTQTIVGG